MKTYHHQLEKGNIHKKNLALPWSFVTDVYKRKVRKFFSNIIVTLTLSYHPHLCSIFHYNILILPLFKVFLSVSSFIFHRLLCLSSFLFFLILSHSLSLFLFLFLFDLTFSEICWISKLQFDIQMMVDSNLIYFSFPLPIAQFNLPSLSSYLGSLNFSTT